MFLEPFATQTIQSPSSSAPPKKATTRLAKSRTPSHVFSKTDLSRFFGDSVPNPSRMMAPSSGHHPPDIRHLIRREISGGFGDMPQYGPDGSPGSQDTSVQNGIRRGSATQQLSHALSANQSSLTLSGHGHGQITAVPEHQLDVEQAINLLQELKKTATPDELVALHRALLPTREVLCAQSPPLVGQSDVPPPPRVTRRRTVMPPGLATRAGFDEDPLRRPGEIAVAERTTVRRRREPEHHDIQIPKRKLVALDLADDTSSMAGTHIVSPAESAYIHTGMYRHGTLWVTNGSATPEPSVVSGVITKTRTVETNVPVSSDLHADPSEVAIQGIQPRRLLPLLDNHVQEAQGPAKVDHHSAAQGSGHGTRREDVLGASDVPSEKQKPKTTSRQREKLYQSLAKNSITPAKWADGPVSFPQLDHSPVHLSPGHNVDYDDVSNPSEDRSPAHLDISHKGSVNGKGVVVHARGSLEIAERVSVDDSEACGPVKSRESADKDLSLGFESRVTPLTVDYRRDSRPKTMHHPDSGYGSDVTSYDAKNRGSREVKPLEVLCSESAHDFQPRDGPETPTESPTSNKKPSPFARFKSMTAARRKSMPFLDSDIVPPSNADAMRGMNSLPKPGTAEHTNKETKKLQKPIPKALLRQREAEMQRLRNDALEDSHKPIANRDAESLARGPYATVTGDSADSSVTTALMDVDKQPVRLDVGLSGDRGRPAMKTDLDHRRERSKTVHGARDAFVHEPEKAFGVARMRSKSLGRDVGRSPRRHGQDWDYAQSGNTHGILDTHCQAAEQLSSHVATNSKVNVAEMLSKRRSVPALQFFQHERQYQIQPGFVMPKPGSAMRETAASAPSRIRGQKRPTPSTPSIEMPPQRDIRAQRAGNGDSKDLNVIKSIPTLHPDENKASLRGQLPTREEGNHRPYSLQIGNMTAYQGPPIHSRDKVTERDSAYSETQNVGTQVCPPTTAHWANNRYECSGNDLVRGNIHDHHTQAAEDGFRSEQRWTYPGVVEGDHDCVTAGYRQSLQQFYQQPVAENHVNSRHSARHAGWPGWERQAQLWRERRENAGANLVYITEYAGQEQGEAPVPPAHSPRPESQEFSTSHQSRIPHADSRHLASPSLRPTGTAPEQANAYQELIMNNLENRPAKADVLRTDSTQSTATFYTVRTSYDHTPAARPSGPRPQSALSYITPTNPAASTSWRDPHEGERDYIRTNSGQYIPYRPDNAPQPEPSQDQPEVHKRYPARPQSDSQHQTDSLESLCDRFGGGLRFGWDRAAGMKSSAGFRVNAAHGPSASEKERVRRGASPVGQKYGIDLSDVPLFLQKV